MLKNVMRKQKTAAMLETIASVANLNDTSCVSGMNVLIGQRRRRHLLVESSPLVLFSLCNISCYFFFRLIFVGECSIIMNILAISLVLTAFW